MRLRPGEDESGLHVAAKAADRGEAARQEWPAFENRMTKLRHGSRAIACAFRTLRGPGTVAEALTLLMGASRPSSSHTALSFQVVETTDAAATRDVTITSVERDASGIRVSYELASELGVGSPRRAGDDLGNECQDLGGHFGFLAGEESSHATVRARGGFNMPMPLPAAAVRCVRITRDVSLVSVRERPAYEIRISLPDQPRGSGDESRPQGGRAPR
jgi:hypothetical protein